MGKTLDARRETKPFAPHVSRLASSLFHPRSCEAASIDEHPEQSVSPKYKEENDMMPNLFAEILQLQEADISELKRLIQNNIAQIGNNNDQIGLYSAIQKLWMYHWCPVNSFLRFF